MEVPINGKNNRWGLPTHPTTFIICDDAGIQKWVCDSKIMNGANFVIPNYWHYHIRFCHSTVWIEILQWKFHARNSFTEFVHEYCAQNHSWHSFREFLQLQIKYFRIWKSVPLPFVWLEILQWKFRARISFMKLVTANFCNCKFYCTELRTFPARR